MDKCGVLRCWLPCARGSFANHSVPSSQDTYLQIGSSGLRDGSLTKEEIDGFDAASKETAGKVLAEAQALAEQIGVSAEL